MELLLGKGELLDFGKCMYGSSVSCREGRCWITQEGDNRDYILNKGSSLSISTKGRLIITAIGPCRIMLKHSVSQEEHASNSLSRWFKGFELAGLQID